MSAEKNKATARQIVERGFNEGDFSVIDQYVAEDMVDHAGPPGLPSGREGVKQLFSMVRAGFPDIKTTIKDEIAEGNKVVHRATTTGTHKGKFMGIPPTGKQATWDEVHIIRFDNGQAVEHWAVMDQMSMLQQLGVVSPPGE